MMHVIALILAFTYIFMENYNHISISGYLPKINLVPLLVKARAHLKEFQIKICHTSLPICAAKRPDCKLFKILRTTFVR